MKANHKTIIFLCIAFLIIGCNIQEKQNEKANNRTITPQKSVPTITDSPITKEATTSVSDLLNEFKDWDGSKSKSVIYTLNYKKDTYILTIVPDNQNNPEDIDWIEIISFSPNLESLNFDSEELQPSIKMLKVIIKEKKEWEEWLRQKFKIIPSEEVINEWKLIVDYYIYNSNKSGISVKAINLRTPTINGSSSSMSNNSNYSSTPKEFENLVVKNGYPIVVAASVEGDNGKTFSKSEAKFLGVWVDNDWYSLSNVEKKRLIKLHWDVFSQWKSDKDIIVIFYDNSLNEEIGTCNQFGVTLKK